MNPPAFVRCRWCGKRLSRHALMAHQLRRCPVRALRAQVHATARRLGLLRRGPDKLEQLLEEMAEPEAPPAREYQALDGWHHPTAPGCRRKRALRQL